MRIMCSREIFTKKSHQQQNFDSDLKGAWHYNHVTFTPIAKYFLLYCRLIYILSILCVTLTIKVKLWIPETFKVGWYCQKITGSSHLNARECTCVKKSREKKTYGQLTSVENVKRGSTFLADIFRPYVLSSLNYAQFTPV